LMVANVLVGILVLRTLCENLAMVLMYWQGRR
jgi:hypothetical protein